MPSLTLAAPAKTNLHLEVLGRRGDGFHELETVFQALELADRVTVALAPGPDRVELRCDDPALPADRGNLAWRAAAAVLDRSPGLGTVSIALEKRIPHGAGLGGGSSDAATVLRALARLAPAAARLDLAPIALSLGSDVPFFLLGGTAHALGRGERLTPLPDAPPVACTVLMPDAILPTPTVFAELDDAERGPRAPLGAPWWAERLPRGWDAALTNRLEAPARRRCPPAAALLDALAAAGVRHVLSGSGAACIAFGDVPALPGVRALPTRFRPRSRIDAVE